MQIILFLTVIFSFPFADAQSEGCYDYVCATCKQVEKLERVCRLNVKNVLFKDANPNANAVTYYETHEIHRVFQRLYKPGGIAFPRFLMRYTDRTAKELAAKEEYAMCDANTRASIDICVAQMNRRPWPDLTPKPAPLPSPDMISEGPRPKYAEAADN